MEGFDPSRDSGNRRLRMGQLIGRPRVVGILVAMLLVASGCGGDGEEADTPASPGPETGVETAQANVEQFLGEVEFEAPGPTFDASSAAGKSVWVIDLNTSIPFNRIMVDSIEEALTGAAVDVTVCDGQGTPDGWNRCANQAVASEPDLIIDQSITPDLISVQLEEAVSKGIHVIEGNIHDPSSSEGLTEGAVGGVAFPFIQVGTLMADWVIADSGGDASAVVVWSSDVPNAADIVQDGIQPEFAELCSGCNVTLVDVPVADWATMMTSSVQGALAADPSVDYVIPIYDGMTTFTIPAIRQAGAEDRVKQVSFNADLAPMQELAAGGVLHADVGISVPWQGWAYADQALRLLSGEEPVTEVVPVRLFDQRNVEGLELTEEAEFSGEWYGPVDFKASYMELWGLS
jgi:ribose transport system substrate-binding protein